jgi:hypothetical protein
MIDILTFGIAVCSPFGLLCTHHFLFLFIVIPNNVFQLSYTTIFPHFFEICV